MLSPQTSSKWRQLLVRSPASMRRIAACVGRVESRREPGQASRRDGRYGHGRDYEGTGIGTMALVSLTGAMARAAADKEALIQRFVAALPTPVEGRRNGDPETRITFQDLLPWEADDEEAARPRARWRIVTAGTSRLYPPPVARDSLAAWHDADASKGRRLLVADLANSNTVAALLSWHFATRKAPTPHLITSAAIARGATGALKVEYHLALWILICLAAAIDRVTLRRGHLGLVLDNAIDLSVDELRQFGFTRGPRGDGYAGEYYVVDA